MECNVNSNLIDFDREAQLTARVEPDKVNKDKISPKRNYITKRSPLVLHEKPKAQEIPPHRYLTFIAELHTRAKRARGQSPIAKEMW